MTEEEKKLQGTTTTTTTTTTDTAETPAYPNVDYTPQDYVSKYDSQIKGLYDQITNRPQFDFKYNAADDALYNQYLDRYMQLGKQAMRDTMGEAASLTGGYGNSYAQGVGQQAYDTYLQGANDKLAELAQQAYGIQYQKYQDEGDRLNQQYAMLSEQEAQDYAKYQDKLTRQGEAFDRLASMITASGYTPSEDELVAANMTDEQARALQFQFATLYPQLAFNMGVISGEEHFALTGAYPRGYTGAGVGGGDMGYFNHIGWTSDSSMAENPYYQGALNMAANGASSSAIQSWLVNQSHADGAARGNEGGYLVNQAANAFLDQVPTYDEKYY